MPKFNFIRNYKIMHGRWISAFVYFPDFNHLAKIFRTFVAPFLEIYNKMKSIRTIVLLLLIGNYSLMAQKTDWQKQIDYEQNRIDLIDGDIDQKVDIGTESQNQLATKIYIQMVDQVQDNILLMEPKNVELYGRGFFEFIKKLEKRDIYHLSASHRNMELIHKLITLNNPTKELELLKNDLKTGIAISDIINLKPYAKQYWIYASKFYPTDVLNKFKALAYTSLGTDVINALARIDPNAIKQYFGSNHLIDRAVKNSKDTVVKLVYDIYLKYGTQSRAYALIEYIRKNQMELEDAETLSQNPRLFYKTLIELRKKQDILADYTVEKELQTIGMERVVEINLRHEDKDTYRFAPIQYDNANEIYSAIVYCPEEIFTSTFLGMYKRMMAKRKDASGYAFLKKLNFNKFRVFLKQCAGYNKLDDFFGTMNDSQANALIAMFAGGLYNYGGNLGPAVDVADTYGSLENEKIKAIFYETIEKELRKCILTSNEHGIKIYGLLLRLTGGRPENYTSAFAFNVPNLDRITSKELFPDSIHIQQHFFFDDEDGLAAFNSWQTLYPSSLFKKEDKGNYIVFQTLQGKKMEVYGNKPQNEIQGRIDLRKYFEKRNRFPDLIVHRGHSYYIQNTLDNMTNSNRVAILGSCGGYQNISKAMENALDVHIISTKQVGTMAVNTVLIQEISETIRTGKDLVWMDVWKQIAIKLKNNPQFKDYIPPYKNLGARFIRAYNEL
jgi:hypothetical protein